jgi:hypothetical protein
MAPGSTVTDPMARLVLAVVPGMVRGASLSKSGWISAAC